MRTTTWLVVLVIALLAVLPRAQETAPATPLTLVSRDGRRPLPTTLQGGREVVALDDVASLFQVSVAEDTLAGGVTITYRGRTIVASANRPTVSVDGRVVALPSPVLRSGRRWLVPIEFLPAALATIYDRRIELRLASRLVLVGDVPLPRVSASIDNPGPPTRASIEISPAAPVTVTSEPGRLVLRIDAESLDTTLPSTGGGLIDRIRVGERPDLVVVALTPAAGPGRSSVITANNVTRVLIEIPAAGTPDVRVPVPDPRPATPEPSIPTSASGWQTIVIDPGHGGEDVGVRGVAGGEEKQVTLDIARQLRAMIESRLGLRVVLTREDDRALGLDERAAVANNGKADLLLSLHVNGALAPDQAGAEVFTFQLDRESEEAVRAATLEAVSLPTLGGGIRRIDMIPWALAQARHVDQSAILAGVLQEELQRQVPMSIHPLRQAPLRLLSAANMPAALVEMAYLTNPEQERRLNSDAFKTTMAQALFSAIVRFRSWSEETPTP